MKRVRASLIVCILGVCFLVGCGKKGIGAQYIPLETAMEYIEIKCASTYDAQRLLMFNNVEVLKAANEAKEMYGSYAILDLNKNGRLEIIISYNAGTGRFSYNRLFEVNDRYDGLIEYKYEKPWRESEVDFLLSDEVVCYYDTEENEYYYIFEDYTFGGLEYYSYNERAIYLKDNQVKEKLFGEEEASWDERIGEFICTYYSKDGDIIGEDEYMNAIENYFKDYKKEKIKITWLNFGEDVLFDGGNIK